MNSRLLTAGVALAALALGAPASAAASATDAGTDCAAQVLSRPFLPWLDLAPYTMPSGGSFEDGATDWSLRKDAEIAGGNESFAVNGATDAMSLRLPPGSSAISAPICVGLGHPTMRFFAKRSGGLLSTLRVDVRYADASGRIRSLPVGVVAAGGNWQPTLPIPVVVNLLTLLPNAQTDVSFAFTPTGNATWRIDDVYVDPFRRS